MSQADGQSTVISSQLHRSLDCEKAVLPEYDLGISELTDLPCSKENAEPKRLSLSLKKKRKSTQGHTTEGAKWPKPLQQCQHFGFEEADEEWYSAMSTPFVPKNTKKNHDWVMKIIHSWCVERNKRHHACVLSICWTNRHGMSRNYAIGWLDLLEKLEARMVPSNLQVLCLLSWPVYFIICMPLILHAQIF